MLARQTAVQKAISMKGQRDDVVDVYNTYLPHPRGYKVKYSDQLCATYVSAIFISLSWTDIVPPECGARQLYRNMEAIGCASSDVRRVPSPGDLIFFGQNSTPNGINHVGIVVDITQGNKRIVYYDISTSGRVAQHYCPVGYAWICGFGMPDYASKDFAPTPEPVPREFKVGDLVTINPGAKWYKGQSIKLSCINDQWYISSVKGDRAVLGMNLAETRNICSPIHTSDITLVVPHEVIETPASEKVPLTTEVDRETWELLNLMATGWGKTIGEVLDKLMEDAR